MNRHLALTGLLFAGYFFGEITSTFAYTVKDYRTYGTSYYSIGDYGYMHYSYYKRRGQFTHFRSPFLANRDPDHPFFDVTQQNPNTRFVPPRQPASANTSTGYVMKSPYITNKAGLLNNYKYNLEQFSKHLYDIPEYYRQPPQSTNYAQADIVGVQSATEAVSAPSNTPQSMTEAPAAPAPKSIGDALYQANKYFKQGQYNQTAEAYLIAVEFQPENPVANLGACLAHTAAGRYETAIEFLRLSLILNDSWYRKPASPLLFYKNLKEFDTHVEQLGQHLRNPNQDLNVMFLFGYLRWIQNRPQEAIAAMNRILQIQPDDPQSALLKQVIEERK